MSTVEEQIEAAHLSRTLPAIVEVNHLGRVDGDWIGSVRTHPRFNKQLFAQQIFVAASTHDPLIKRFTVQIIDNPRAPATPGSGISWHTFDATTGAWSGPEHMPPDWSWDHLGLY